jgi:hypothetical protein
VAKSSQNIKFIGFLPTILPDRSVLRRLPLVGRYVGRLRSGALADKGVLLIAARARSLRLHSRALGTCA